MPTQYILRFDDVAPGMAWQKFQPFKARLQELGVKCVLGVVPDCKDTSLQVEPDRVDFFDRVRSYKAFGDTIAQHGCFHLYTSGSSGLLGINPRSEFADLSFDAQLKLLAHGKSKLQQEGVWEPYFMAPAHSFDDGTLDALKALDFVALTDGYGFFPYSYRGLTMVPQLTAAPLNVGFGYSTVCVHVNTTTEQSLAKLMHFIEKNLSSFVDFKEVVAGYQKTPFELYGAPTRYLTRILLKLLRATRAAST